MLQSIWLVHMHVIDRCILMLKYLLTNAAIKTAVFECWGFRVGRTDEAETQSALLLCLA